MSPGITQGYIMFIFKPFYTIFHKNNHHCIYNLDKSKRKYKKETCIYHLDIVSTPTRSLRTILTSLSAESRLGRVFMHIFHFFPLIF